MSKPVGLVLILLIAIFRNPSVAMTRYPAVIAQHLDLRVNPCEDFYKFSCGGWSRTVPLPSDPNSMRDTLYTHPVEATNHQVLLKLLQASQPTSSFIGTKYFDSCMNTTCIHQLGFTPLTRVFAQIDAVNNSARDLFQIAGELTMVSFNFLSTLFVDTGGATKLVHNVLQHKPGSLPLPASVYEFDDFIVDLEPAYREYISSVLTHTQVANSSSVKPLVDTIVKLEKSIAKIMTSPTTNAMDLYSPMTFQDASTKFPLLFQAVARGMFTKAGVALPAGHTPVIIHTPSSLTKLESLVSSTQVDALKTLMKYHYINANSDLLSHEIFHTMMEAMPQRPTREKFCVDYVVKQLPNRMGKEYAAKMLDVDSANLAKDMIARVEAVLKQRLVTGGGWLDPSARETALQKLAKVTTLISHSDQVEELDGVTLKAEEFFDNTDAILEWKNLQQLRKLNKPIVKGEWPISGSSAHAYYEPSQNTVTFPAGILQPPFFNKAYLAAINYGATGTRMGHELIHVLDNTGRFYDGDGTMMSWWTPKTSAEFDKRKQCLIDQYANFKAVADGNLVVGQVNRSTFMDENLADVSALALAFEAYQKLIEQVTPQPQPTTQQEQEELLPEMDIEVIIETLPYQQRQRQLMNDKPTPTTSERVASTKTELEQLFYIAFAQSSCAVERDGLEDRVWNEQASSYFRVTGSIMNDPYFGQLFNCPVGTKMNPKHKCSIW